jgi:hypothetical protein
VKAKAVLEVPDTGKGARRMSHPHTEGTTYPVHHVVAIISDAEEARQAAQDLRAAGFAENDIMLYQGQDGLAAIRSKETLLTRFINALEQLSADKDEGAGRDVFLGYLQEGKTGLLIYAPQREQVETARL